MANRESARPAGYSTKEVEFDFNGQSCFVVFFYHPEDDALIDTVSLHDTNYGEDVRISHWLTHPPGLAEAVTTAVNQSCERIRELHGR